jgi:hypothetical protein
VVTLAVADVFMPCNLICACLCGGRLVDGIHDQLVGAFAEDEAGVESGPILGYVPGVMGMAKPIFVDRQPLLAEARLRWTLLSRVEPQSAIC